MLKGSAAPVSGLDTPRVAQISEPALITRYMTMFLVYILTRL